MGEGTRVFNVQEEIADLKRRLDLLQQNPVHVVPMGCVCPVGAEHHCGGLACPRRGALHGLGIHFGVK